MDINNNEELYKIFGMDKDEFELLYDKLYNFYNKILNGDNDILQFINIYMPEITKENKENYIKWFILGKMLMVNDILCDNQLLNMINLRVMKNILRDKGLDEMK